MTLPASTVVDVTVTANDRFPPRTGFGTVLFLQSKAVAGEVDGTVRTKLYGSMQEVEDDFLPADEAYKAALDAFSQNPRPRRLKIAYYDATTAVDAATLQAELDDILTYDGGWYWIVPEADLRDTAIIDGLVDWTEANGRRFNMIASNDANMTDPADATNLAARFKGTVERTAIIYSSKADEYPDMALAAYLGTFNLDEPGTSYTSMFKRLRRISVEDIPTADVAAITGTTPHLSTATATGHIGNVYVDIGGVPQLYGGQTLTPYVFIDEIHFRDWLTVRTEEQILGVLTNNNKVPYTAKGMAMLTGAVDVVMGQAKRNGSLAEDIDEATGLYQPAYTIDEIDIFSVPEAQRKARIAPAIRVDFRAAGAVHYAAVRYNVSF